MTKIDSLLAQTTLPVIGAPMFLVSGPDLVVAQCRAGVIGTFPTLNARPQHVLGEWLRDIRERLAAARAQNPQERIAPYGVNLVIHPSNPRWQEDLATCVAHQVPLYITSLHAPTAVVEAARGYGAIVLHDVTNARHARKAVEAGVDGLILVCAGAGGHAGRMNPLALVNEVREFYDGPLILSGCITHGKDILAARAMGCALAYMGTRFIATEESMATPAYKQMVLDSSSTDLVYTPYFSGVPANYLMPSIVAAGIDPTEITDPQSASAVNLDKETRPKAWKDIWSAGQGVSVIHRLLPTAELVGQLRAEYQAALGALAG